MRIQLSDHFTYKRLLRFVASPILMMICTSLYGIVDGFFVSNYVGKTPFAAVNLVMPVMMAVGTIGFMIGAGENGIAAYGVIMYVNSIFMAIFMGYALGSSPIVSFHYGAQNHAELKSLFRKSLVIMCVTGLIMMLLAELTAAPLVKIFAGYDTELFEMTCRGFRLYSLSFAIMGINVWGSAFFTALNNGVVSAAISFLWSLIGNSRFIKSRYFQYKEQSRRRQREISFHRPVQAIPCHHMQTDSYPHQRQTCRCPVSVPL